VLKRSGTLGAGVLFLLRLAAPASAQESPAAVPQTRADVIAAERVEKVATLWPERQNAVADLVNGWVERGLKEGLDSGLGANGLQVVLGGMRSGQGMSGGVGYRRSDLFREQLGLRGTVRGTIHGAYMLDLNADFNGLRTRRTALRWYTKYEHSPEIDYYGRGNSSSKDDRTSYRYDDLSSDFFGSFEAARYLHLGVTGGYFQAHTARSDEDGPPPIDEAFAPDAIPGFGNDTDFTRIGAFGYFDSRDSQTGPRSGAVYGVQYREYWDVQRKTFAFRQVQIEAQQYFPYFNRGRVVAVRGAVILTYPKGDDAVPFYLQPMLGGSDELRGFGPYRFRDYHSLSLGLEHRWHAFSVLDMALFADAGKVVPLKKELTPERLHFDGGIGFRFRLRSAILSRIDFAGSDEGFRMVWTFSDVFSANLQHR
jgi:outer membrane protein assembly factor BamA